jgi:DNA (cytosine-5)-methyltransferase 1
MQSLPKRVRKYGRRTLIEREVTRCEQAQRLRLVEDLDELVAIDLFAGLGGLTEGAEQAGARVVVALNHWDFAVQVHALNHTNTEHLLQNAHEAKWKAMPVFNLLMGGPSCQGHTFCAQPQRKHIASVQAKHEVDRATAWAMIDCAEQCSPEWIIAENVVPWLRWPLFDLWLAALEKLGYYTRVLILDASRYGVPQARFRVFVIGGRSKDQVERVAQMVEAEAIDEDAPRPGAGTIIRWDEGPWRPASECGEGSRARIMKGLDLDVEQWWCQHVTGHKGKRVDQPFSTITGADQHVVCRRTARGDVEYRTLLAKELLAAQDFPRGYKLPPKYFRKDLTRAVGNAVPIALGRVIVSSIAKVRAAA